MNKCSALAILRTDKLNNKTGLAPVSIQFFINGKKKVVALGIYITPDQWDANKRKIVANSDQMKAYNLVIEQALAKANKIFVDYHLMSKVLTPDLFLEEFTGANNRNDFIAFFTTELERRLKYDIISKNTYKIQKSTLNKLKTYKKIILFTDLTPEFIERFDAWHKKQIQESCQLRGKIQRMDSINTRQKTKSHIRTYVKLAIERHGIRISDPFKKIKVREIKGERVFLEKEELQQLHYMYNDDRLTHSESIVLCKFMFACFTSIRISDSQRIHEMKLVNDCISFVPEKTKRIGKHLKIHLNETAKLYYNRLKSQDFTNYTDQEMNRSLKRIAALAGINKPITFHVARHTFATQFISNGGDVTVLQQLMGHSDLRATMIYVHMAKNAAKEQIMKMDNIIDV
jgi:integrase/recombinase XerD